MTASRLRSEPAPRARRVPRLPRHHLVASDAARRPGPLTDMESFASRDAAGTLRDVNGNTVGRWEFK